MVEMTLMEIPSKHTTQFTILLKHDACLPEHVIPPLPVEVVIYAVHLPLVVEEESAHMVLLYVEQVHHHGQILLMQVEEEND